MYKPTLLLVLIFLNACATQKSDLVDIKTLAPNIVVEMRYASDNNFVRWAQDIKEQRTKAVYYPNIDKSLLFPKGYIAERSGHSRASTIDLTLVSIEQNGQTHELDMGTDYDFFDEISHTNYANLNSQQRQNRLLLKSVMTSSGFVNYPFEWWHYTLTNEPYPNEYFDWVIE